jgi:CRISPR system Cascade subunit CasE
MSDSLYLSLLTLDPVASRVARAWLSDVHAMHRMVMSGFPTSVDPAARRALGVLFRTDTTDRLTRVLVQSTAEPNWSMLDPDSLAAPVRTRDAEALLCLPSGARLRFRLVANPTRAIRPPGRDSRHAQHVPLRRDEGPNSRLGWLLRKGEHGGFTVHLESVVAADRPLMRGRRDGNARLTIEPCRFEGILEITDAECFRVSITSGIGRAKAYGCGLLSVGRP